MARRSEEHPSVRGLGHRLRLARLRRRKQQTVVAGLAGITTDYLYQIEHGLKLPSLAVLVELARVLDLPLSELLPEASTARLASRAVAEAPLTAARRPSVPERGSVPGSASLYTAMTSDVPPSRPANAALPKPVLPAELADRIREAWHRWQFSPTRYSQVGALLPALVTDVEHQLRATDDPADRRLIVRHASDLYGLLRSFCKRAGRFELSLLSAERAIRTAELADDPLRLAAARWNLAHVLLADGQIAGAEDIAMSAATAARAHVDSVDAGAVCGALLLLGAVAAARRQDISTARHRLGEARQLADRTGERNACWTAFGPTNVAMHAANVEFVAGHAAEGLHLAERIDHRLSPSIERRVAFLLDQAQGWRQRRDNAQVLLLLLEAERQAPEDLRYRPAGHRLIRDLVHRGRRSVAEQAAQLASRLGVAV